MADNYQLNQMDLIELNYILRRIQERLDEIDSRHGAVTFHNEVSMDGHKISDGPEDQTAAESTEFITRAYLNSQEAAETMRDNLRPGGKAPLSLP